MNNLKIEVNIFIAFALLIVFFVAGGFVGRDAFTKTILISDDIEICESAGGKYNIFYSEVSEAYKVTCDVPEERVFDYNYYVN